MPFDLREKIQHWKNGEISDKDIALQYFLYFHIKKYPNKNLENIIGKEITASILEEFNFKKVKSKALVSLVNLCHGKWDFKIIENIPTPKEVLYYQSQGIRPVTMKYQEELKPILMREDCLEFFLHDLEHGYMFFHDGNLKQMQVSFFKKIYECLESGQFDQYLRLNGFAEKFDYLISDMNTHSEHYKSYLNSLLPKEDIHKFDYLF